MNYAAYVYAAYAIFAIVMLWDLLAPLLGIRQTLRAVRQHTKRQANKVDINTALADAFGDEASAPSKEGSP